MLKQPKIALVGAAGNVGASVLQYCMQKELGDLVLVDLKPNVAQGRALDLTQSGAFGNFQSSFVSGTEPTLLADADVVVVTAGVPRKPGQSREELVNINAGIVKGICENVKKYAPNSVLIVVSNPLDAMLTVAQKVTQFPRERVIGMSGVLDSSRFRANIAKALDVHVQDVCAIVMGAHTDKDMVPVVSTASVNGVPLTSLLTQNQLDEIVAKTKRGGAEITELIGTSAWLAPGLGVGVMVESIVRNQGRILPCSIELKGEYGLSDVCLCVPVKLTQKGAIKIIEVPLSENEKTAFQASYQACLDVKKIALEQI